MGVSFSFHEQMTWQMVPTGFFFQCKICVSWHATRDREDIKYDRFNRIPSTHSCCRVTPTTRPTTQKPSTISCYKSVTAVTVSLVVQPSFFYRGYQLPDSAAQMPMMVYRRTLQKRETVVLFSALTADLKRAEVFRSTGIFRPRSG